MTKISILASRLRELRRIKGITQRDLAASLFMSHASIGHYETGRQEPSIQTLIKFANFYEVSVDYIIGKTDLKYTVDENKMLDAINLSDEELMKKYDFVADGKPIDPEEIKKLLKIVRYLETQED